MVVPVMVPLLVVPSVVPFFVVLLLFVTVAVWRGKHL